MNKKNMLKAVIVVAVALAFLMPGSAAITNEKNGNKNNRGNTVVSISPSTQNVEIGQRFYVDVYVETGELIIGTNVGSSLFDPDPIQANSVTKGDGE